MAKVIAGIGIPGSGKTTVLKTFAHERRFVYISPDEVREEISGDARIQSDMQEVWRRVFQRMTEALQKGKDVVLDSTNYKAEDRRTLIEKADASGAQVIGVYFDVPLELALERNKSRERVVPEHAVQRMHKRLKETPPCVEEGFYVVITPEELGKL